MNEPRTPVIDFDQWAESLIIKDPEERIIASDAARALLKQPTFRLVMAQVERNLLHEMVNCPPNNPERVIEIKHRLHGVRAVTRAIQVLADQNRQDKVMKQQRGT